MPTLTLNFLMPGGEPARVEVEAIADDRVKQPYLALVDLSYRDVDDNWPELVVLVRPDASMDDVHELIPWIERRLTRRFNPDGSEPDFWEDRSNGQGVQVWARHIGDMPPLD